jgi:hypothetical protein
MIIPDTFEARVQQAQEVEGASGADPRQTPPETAPDRLDLQFRIFGKVADRLSPEGLSAMDRLLNGGPRRGNDLRRLIAALDAEEDERPGRRRRRDPFDALDRVLDAGSGGMGNLFAVMQDMSPEDQQAFLQTLSTLLKRGVMGYEYRKVNGQPYKVYLENEMGTPVHRARLYRREQSLIPG